jgi:hypothetical protein
VQPLDSHFRNRAITKETPKTKEQTPWPESASELYWPSHRRLSAKLVPTFADRGVLRSQRGGSPMAVILISWPELLQLLNCTHDAEWTLFQIYYFSENLTGPGINRTQTSGSVARSLTTRSQRLSHRKNLPSAIVLTIILLKWSGVCDK